MAELAAAQVRAFRLERQRLLERAPRERLLDVVAEVGGVHAQVMSAAELQLWARVEAVSPYEVREALWERRELVKTWAMRGTLHLLPASEWGLWAAAVSTRTAWRRGSWLRHFGVSAEEMEALIAAIDEALDSEPVTREELAELAALRIGPHLREVLLHSWGSTLKPAAAAGVLVFGPNRGRNVAFVNPRAWLGPWEAVDPDEAMRTLVRRHLRAYGPATPDDFARWWGGDVAPARRLLRSLGAEVAPVRAEGRDAWLLAEDVALVEGLEPVRGVRLLPLFDPYTLHYRPRERLVPEGRLEAVYRQAGWISAVVLVDGAVAGVWESARRGRRPELSITPFVRFPKRVTAGIDREAERLAAFLGLPVDVTT